MPSLSTVKASNASYASHLLQSASTPVAIFIGGTAGIGEATVKALANYLHGNVHVILVGRTREPGERVLRELVKPSPSPGEKQDIGVIREFIPCDVSLMSSVDKMCLEITKLLESRLKTTAPPKINYIFFSANHSNLWGGHRWTEEGIDKQLAVRYYHRFKTTFKLMPLLRNAKDKGEDARVVSILASGITWWFDEDDFGFKKSSGLGLVLKGVNTNMVAAVYNDLMVESFADHNPGISFTNSMPGMVSTDNALHAFTIPFRAHWILKPLELFFFWIWILIFIKPEDSAQYHLYDLFQADEGREPERSGGEKKGKFYRRSRFGDDLGYRYHRKDQEVLKRRFWEHTTKVTELVE
ncbi:hypothetical protein D9758_007716 [Tetrapyrgos nigripes]|uniref:NAD(P)-binding protein n=1 Tax=Tetrapyrgos nigripes TaxID=182062 RepID=A0A8H5G5E5_9AGAR|nr:hypothetical protein D9758_007716 [Tetrapyrgos nigripes]